jgi:small-conductance mechanosensitive channel
MQFESLFQEDWFRWAAGLSLSFPLVMLLLTELIERLKRLDSPLLAAVKLVRQWIVPLAGVILLLHRVLGIEPDQILLKCLRTSIWLAIIIASLSGVNALIFKQADAASWQAKVPSLLVDMGRAILVMVGLAIIIANVWGADLGGLLGALGVGSLVLGLALQDSMGNLFSGVALLFERPFSVDDWLNIDDKIGQVVAITWRSVHLRTPQQQLIIVPNSVLAQGSFFNYSRPTKIHGEELTLGFSYDDPPNKVMGILAEMAETTEGILAQPPPTVEIMSYDDFAIGYRLRFFVADYGQLSRLRSAVMSRVWYASQRYGLTIPFPTQAEYQVIDPVTRNSLTHQQIIDGLQSLPSFSSLSSETLVTLAQDAELHEYGNNEAALVQGEAIDGIYLILRGRAKVIRRDADGELQPIGELTAGDIFGERLLLGQLTSDLTIKAGEDLQVVIFNPSLFQGFIDRIPNLASIINETMEARRRSLKYKPN